MPDCLDQVAQAMECRMQNAQDASKTEEFDLLDVFLVLAASWRLLVFGPLVVGLAIGAFMFVQRPPITHSASTVIWLHTNAPSTFMSEAFLTEFADSLDREAGALDWNWKDLASAIRFRPSSEFGSVSPAPTEITVTTSNADVSRTLLDRLIEAVQRANQADARRAAVVEGLGDYVDHNDALMAVLERFDVAAPADEGALLQASVPVSLISYYIDQNQAKISELRERLAGWPDGSILRPLSVEQERQTVVWLLVPILSAIALEMILLFVVFVRAASSRMAATPEGKRKMDAIRDTMIFWPRRRSDS